jgi:hypothetical protein
MLPGRSTLLGATYDLETKRKKMMRKEKGNSIIKKVMTVGGPSEQPRKSSSKKDNCRTTYSPEDLQDAVLKIKDVHMD